MTMTDTEAKALALTNEVRRDKGKVPYGAAHWPKREESESLEALCRVIEREAATEARHAAELREQAERFSEAVSAWRKERIGIADSKVSSKLAAAFEKHLAPFILPAPDPDPLVEAFASLPVGFAGCVDGADALRAAMQARGYEWRKIGEAGE